jgi:hypothetical protein
MLCLLQFGSIGTFGPSDEVRCSCLDVQELAHALADSDAVFIGRVVSASERLAQPIAADEEGVRIVAAQRIVRFRVLGSWKGASVETIEVRTGVSDADCGFPFQRGESYLVFARSEGDALSTSTCSRTATIEDAIHDLVSLGASPWTPEME